MNDGWNSCGCTYLDAAGNPINGPGSGADGTPVTTSCETNWGLIAAAVLAAIVGMHLASSGTK